MGIFICPAFSFQSTRGGGGEWRRSRLCSLQQKLGGFSPPFLNSLQRHRKGYLKPGKDSLLKECTQRSQELFCGIPIVQVTAEWPLLYKPELWIIVLTCYSLCGQAVNPRSRLPWSHSSLENQGARAFSCRSLPKRRTGKSTQNMIRGGGGGWQNNKSYL